MDVHNAFLHGELDEEVYMKLPPGFASPTPGKVCRLGKSLYGLRQAPRCWFAKLAAALNKYGFQQSYSDYSLFTYKNRHLQLHVLVYVDDLIISGNDGVAVQRFKDYLSQCFHMKDLGKLKYFLGIEVAQNSKVTSCVNVNMRWTLFLRLDCYELSHLGLLLKQNHKLALVMTTDWDDLGQYRCLVGSLIYLTLTQPKLSYCVHILAQFMQQSK